jgi:hypothetical protein
MAAIAKGSKGFRFTAVKGGWHHFISRRIHLRRLNSIRYELGKHLSEFRGKEAELLSSWKTQLRIFPGQELIALGLQLHEQIDRTLDLLDVRLQLRV